MQVLQAITILGQDGLGSNHSMSMRLLMILRWVIKDFIQVLLLLKHLK